MSSVYSQDSSSERSSEHDAFQKPKTKKRGRPINSNPTTPEGTTKKANTNPLETMLNPTLTTNNITQKKTNYAFPLFTYNFILHAPLSTTRVQLAMRWEELLKGNKDVIKKQEHNFILKQTIQKQPKPHFNNSLTTKQFYSSNHKTTQHPTSQQEVHPPLKKCTHRHILQ